MKFTVAKEIKMIQTTKCAFPAAKETYPRS